MIEQRILDGALTVLHANPSALKDGWNILKCPFHGDTHPSLSFNSESGFYRCMACGASGFVATYEKKRKKNLEDELQVLNKKPFEKIHADFKIFSNDYADLLSCNEGIAFLTYRGITPDICKRYNMFLIREGVLFSTLETGEVLKQQIKNRVFIPLELHGQLKSFEMRAIEKRKDIKKVLYPKESTMDFMFDYDNLNPYKPIIITEGLMECLLLKSFYDNCSCIFKALPSESSLIVEQLRYLSKNNNIIYLSNNDKAGETSRNTLKKYVNNKIYCFFPPTPFKDLGDIYEKCSKNAVRIFLTRMLPKLFPNC